MDIQSLQVLALFLILLASAAGVALPPLIWKSDESAGTSLSFRIAKVASLASYTISLEIEFHRSSAVDCFSP